MIFQPRYRLGGRGFTLVELIVAMGVFMLIMSLFLVTTQGVQRIWTHSGRKVEALQSGRAVLEIFSRELAGAQVSDRLQLVQTPDLSGLVTKPPLVAPNAPSLFWIGPVDSGNRIAPAGGAASSNPCAVGYFLTREDETSTYLLNRLVVPPENPNYQVGKVTAAWDSVKWLEATDSSLFDPENPDSAVSTIAEGVVAMWIRCFDMAGNPVPWPDSAGGLSAAAPMQFNSAMPFQMAGREAPFENGRTFQYLVSTAAPAHRLPGSIEITLVLLDERTLARKPQVPSMPNPTSIEAVPAQIQAFQDELAKVGITAEVLSVRLPLCNTLP